VTPKTPPPFEHAHHERTLVLRHFEDDPDLTREERLLVSALLRTCPWCAALGPEVELIRKATRAMAVPPAGRDFRITPSQARRARSFNVAALGQRFRAALQTELVRPLASAAVAVGLVLVVVGAVPYLTNSGSSSGSESTTPPTVAAAGESFSAQSALGSPNFSAEGTPSIGESNIATNPKANGTPPVGADTSAATPVPAPSTARIAAAGATSTPTQKPEIALSTGPGPSPQVAANAGNGGALATQPKSNEIAAQQQLPPLLIFGVLLAIIGLLVLGLTVLARRMENGAG
jgi:hypothetical protein